MENKYKYLRIQGREIVENTLTGRGVFSMFIEMIRNEVMEQEDAFLFLKAGRNRTIKRGILINKTLKMYDEYTIIVLQRRRL